MKNKIFKNYFIVFLSFLIGVIFAIALSRVFDIVILSGSENHLKQMAVSCENHKRLIKSLEAIENSEIPQQALTSSRRTLELMCEELKVYESFLVSKGVDPAVLKAKIKYLKSHE